MNLKRTGSWLFAIVVASVLFVGRLTNFTYKDIEIQFYDSYYVFSAVAIVFIAVISISLVSMVITSIKILRNHHILLRVILILILAAILFVPMLMLYIFVMMLSAP